MSRRSGLLRAVICLELASCSIRLANSSFFPGNDRRGPEHQAPRRGGTGLQFFSANVSRTSPPKLSSDLVFGFSTFPVGDPARCAGRCRGNFWSDTLGHVHPHFRNDLRPVASPLPHLPSAFRRADPRRDCEFHLSFRDRSAASCRPNNFAVSRRPERDRFVFWRFRPDPRRARDLAPQLVASAPQR